MVKKLQDWLRSSSTPNVTNVARLLDVAFSSPNSPGLPVDLYLFQSGDDCCLLIFCILSEIDCTKALPSFLAKGEVDRRLPLRWATVSDTLRAACIQDTEMPSRFFGLQWRHCPAKFDLYLQADWYDEVVLPISEQNPITKGGIGTLWQISVSEEFIGQKLRDISSGSRYKVHASTNTEPEWVCPRSFHLCCLIPKSPFIPGVSS